LGANEDRGWENGGFGVSSDDSEKPPTTAEASCNIDCCDGQMGKCRFEIYGQWGVGSPSGWGGRE